MANSIHPNSMDFSYSEDHELQQLHAQVQAEPEEFENWEKLIRAAEQQEGGLSRNSNPQAIAATRETYDQFLARFPLFFGYWKKYADLEFAIGGTESAEMVYERGVASIGISVDLWTNYCTFKIDTSHDSDVIRELFERGADYVGLDFLAHPFWDKWIEYEERFDAHDRIFSILSRVIHIPLHQYGRYFERYRGMTARRPVSELAPADVVDQFRREIQQENANKPLNEADVERELRTRLDRFHVEIFHRTSKETTRRWTYEQKNERPYYHVTELDEAQLVNWRKYLDFEEVEGDYARTKFLYERCLVTTANYDEFWFRYARWTFGQKQLSKELRDEEMRNIFQRASCIFVPICRPEIRLQYARFEESLGNAETAIEIHQSILAAFPGHLETMISLANVHRRTFGVDAALKVLNAFNPQTLPAETRGAIVAETARMTWRAKGDAEGARQIFESRKSQNLASRQFWVRFFEFELEQPTSESEEPKRHQRIKAVSDDIRLQSVLPSDLVASLTAKYFHYLTERGGREAMAEFMDIDKEINGPFSVASGKHVKLAEDGQESTTVRRMVTENGHPGLEVNEVLINQGTNPYTKYYAQQGEFAATG